MHEILYAIYCLVKNLIIIIFIIKDKIILMIKRLKELLFYFIIK